MSRLIVNQIQGDAVSKEVEIPTGHKLQGVDTGAIAAPGSVIQIVHGKLTTAFSGTGTAGTFPADNYFLDPGIEATITPKFSDSQILITTHLYVGQDTTSSGYQVAYQILKAGAILTAANGATTAGRLGVAAMINDYGTSNQQYHVNQMSGTHMDPDVGTTAATTYKVRIRGYSGSPTVYINRNQAFQDGNLNYDNIPQSTITLTEIKT